jgi:ABC-type transporter Mla subunit MlaD
MTLEGHSHTFDLNQLIEETGAKIQSLKNSAHENLSHQDETINEVMQTLEELTQDINTTDQQRRRIEKLKAEIDAMMQTQETIRDLQDKVITHIKKSTTPDLQVAGAATKLKDEFTVSEVYP